MYVYNHIKWNMHSHLYMYRTKSYSNILIKIVCCCMDQIISFNNEKYDQISSTISYNR